MPKVFKGFAFPSLHFTSRRRSNEDRHIYKRRLRRPYISTITFSAAKFLHRMIFFPYFFYFFPRKLILLREKIVKRWKKAQRKCLAMRNSADKNYSLLSSVLSKIWIRHWCDSVPAAVGWRESYFRLRSHYHVWAKWPTTIGQWTALIDDQTWS